MPEPMKPEDLARLFHETYERLAPDHGYKTREATAVPWDDVPANNKALMIAVAAEVGAAHEAMVRAAIGQELYGMAEDWSAQGPPGERLRPGLLYAASELDPPVNPAAKQNLPGYRERIEREVRAKVAAEIEAQIPFAHFDVVIGTLNEAARIARGEA